MAGMLAYTRPCAAPPSFGRVKYFGLALPCSIHGPSNGCLNSKLSVRDVNLQAELSAIERLGRKQLDTLPSR
jgi:hypothetical protein